MENVEIKNQKNGAKSILFWGLSNNMTSAMTARDFVVIDCVFHDSDAQWEAITLENGLNVKMIGCTFGSKSAIYNLYNAGSYDVSIVGCHFRDCGNAVAGKGNTHFVGCDFFNSSMTNISYNVVYSGCSFDEGIQAAGLEYSVTCLVVVRLVGIPKRVKYS
jgi:hypothetical protein